MLACCADPSLLDHDHYGEDVKRRAKEYLESFDGGSLGECALKGGGEYSSRYSHRAVVCGGRDTSVDDSCVAYLIALPTPSAHSDSTRLCLSCTLSQVAG